MTDELATTRQPSHFWSSRKPAEPKTVRAFDLKGGT